MHERIHARAHARVHARQGVTHARKHAHMHERIHARAHARVHARTNSRATLTLSTLMPKPSPQKHRQFKESWTQLLPWLFLVSTLAVMDSEVMTCVNGAACAGCEQCAAMHCSVCVERNTPSVDVGRHTVNAWAKGGCTAFRQEAVQLHVRNYHTADLDQSQMSITDSVLKANAAWKDSIISIMRNVYWLVKENVPMRKCESLCALMGMQGFPLGRKYVNAKAARDFLRSIAHVIRNEIIRAAVMSPCLGLMIDESTDISHTNQMILYLRLLLCGCFQTVFWLSQKIDFYIP